MTVLVGGVAQLYQGDLDLGRLAVERLRDEPLGDDVLVEELSYGAVAVAQRLQELGPRALVLVGAAERGGEPGSVARKRIRDPELAPEQLQASVGDAVTGYVSMDLVVHVASAFGALPPLAVAIEVEPASVAPSEQLSAAARTGLERALELVRAEVRQTLSPGACG